MLIPLHSRAWHGHYNRSRAPHCCRTVCTASCESKYDKLDAVEQARGPLSVGCEAEVRLPTDWSLRVVVSSALEYVFHYSIASKV